MKNILVAGGSGLLAVNLAYMFRDNIEMGQVAFRKFEEGMKYMRKLLVNENVYLRAI